MEESGTKHFMHVRLGLARFGRGHSLEDTFSSRALGGADIRMRLGEDGGQIGANHCHRFHYAGEHSTLDTEIFWRLVLGAFWGSYTVP